MVFTLLHVVFMFYIPYRTRDGCPINMIFACGHDVAVNAIVWLPFLGSTKSVIGLNENIVEMTAVDRRPFPVNLHHRNEC